MKEDMSWREKDRERGRWVRDRVRDGGRYGLEREGEMGGREILYRSHYLLL